MIPHDVLALIELIANVAIVPLVAMLWNVQGRLSNIEGQLRFITRRNRRNQD